MLTLYLGLDPTSYPDQKELCHFPIIEICPSSPKELEPKILKGSEANLCVLSSSQACHILFEQAKGLGVEKKYQEMTFVSVGRKTSETLASYGALKVETAKVETAEGVVAVLENMDLRDRKIFYPHSKRSRPVISDFLAKEDLIDCVLYTTQQKQNLPHVNIKIFESIVFTSSSVVSAFYSHFGPDALVGKQVVVIGPITENKIFELYPSVKNIKKYSEL